jgi:Ni/Co efflux regulator RcnB
VIYDPHRYGLYAPPRGHAWMHVDNDVYLTQLGSGLIVQVLRDSFY